MFLNPILVNMQILCIFKLESMKWIYFFFENKYENSEYKKLNCMMLIKLKQYKNMNVICNIILS